MKTALQNVAAALILTAICSVFLAAVEPGLILGFSSAEAATPRTNAIQHVSPERFSNLIVAPRGDCSWDFPAIGGGSDVCAESATCLAVGANYTDVCLVATNFGADGGDPAPAHVTFSCRAITDGVIFKACHMAADSGTTPTTNLPDGGFVGRIVH